MLGARFGSRASAALVLALTLLGGAAAAQPTTTARHWRGQRSVGRSALQLRTLVQQQSARGTELLQLGEERFGDGDRILRFAEIYRGVPVLGGGASLRLDARGQAREMFHGARVTWPSTTPTVDKHRALASLATLSRFPVSEQRTHLALITDDGVAELVWVAFPSVPAVLPMAPRLIVSAVDGRLIEARDLAVSAKARVYPTNPTKSPTLADFDLPIASGDEPLVNPFLKAKNCIDNKTVKDINVGFGVPIRVHVCEPESTATPDANGDYIHAPSDMPGTAAAAEDAFSSVSMYYHATRAYAFFRELQGDPDAEVVANGQILAISNLRMPQGFDQFDVQKMGNPDLPLVPLDNAFFSPKAEQVGQVDPFAELFGATGGGMYFGQGRSRDFGYDGDVVYHEFTHAVVDKTLKLGQYARDAFGLSAAPGAMNEALADYFSSAITGDPDVGEYASEGFGFSEGHIRTLDNQDTCSTAVFGLVHNDSTLFSGALWTARQATPEADRRAFDASIYKTMRGHAGTDTPSYEELGTLFVEGLQTDLPASAPLLEGSLTERGILPGCARIREQSGDTLIPGAPYFSSIGGAAVRLSGMAPGLVQGHRSLPAGTTAIDVRVERLASGGSSSFGGGSFTPHLFVRFGAPVGWTYTGSRATAESDFDVALTADAETASVAVEVPEGATDVYFQVANSGSADGVYAAFGAVVTAGAPVDGNTDGGPAAEPVDDGGCNCSTHGAPLGAGGLCTLAGTVALLLGLRRRAR